MIPTTRTRSRTWHGALIAAAAVAIAGGAAAQEKVLRVGMTAADIPYAAGQPDQGFEGFRFMGYMVYDPLVLWDLSKYDEPATLVPGLAESWSVDPADKTKWTFKLRKGVKYHDGTEFTADDVLWNFEVVRDSKAKHYDPKQAALIGTRIPDVKEIRKIDSHTIEIITPSPTAYIPYEVSFWFFPSKKAWEKAGSWEAFAKAPVGTGPWKVARLVPRERAEMTKNADYWNKDRVPKSDRVILLPIPEASARTAALLSRQVDWIEAPSPDTIPRLKQAGMQIVTNGYPHNWAIKPSRIDGSPWNDVRVRKAANLCIDREGINKLLGGLSIPAKGHVVPGDAWFGKPKFELGYKPDEARKLMTEAGFSATKKLTVKIAISTSGSGQMQPLPMFEALQANMNECFFNVTAEVMEWNALTAHARNPANHPDTVKANIDSQIISHALQDPFSGFERFFLSARVPPNGSNWGVLKEPVYDALLKQASETFDIEAQNIVLSKLHEAVVENAEWIWVTHDVNPRAMARNVKGFVQAKSWFQDLTPVYKE
ncbi:MAG: ABC transporter substrate-binding protein [Alphaproteobacteria bacterium]